MENFEELIEKDCFLKNIKRCYIIKIIENFNIEKVHIIYNNDIKSFEIKFIKDNSPYFFKYKVKRRRNKSVSRKNKKLKDLDANANLYDSENTNCFNKVSYESASINNNEQDYSTNEVCIENNINMEKDNTENDDSFKCKNKNCIFDVDKKNSYCNLCVNYVRNCVKCNNEFADEITVLDLCDNCDDIGNEPIYIASNDNISISNIENNINKTITKINTKDILKEDIINEISKLLEITTFTINTLKEIFDLVNKGNPKKVFSKLIKITNNVSDLNKIPEDFNNIIINIINNLDKI